MAKTILKILYLTVAAVLAVLFGVLNFNTGANEEYISILSEAVNGSDPKRLAYVTSSYELPYDNEPYVVKDKDGKSNLSVFGSINQLGVKYFKSTEDSEATETFSRIEFVYYLFITNIDFKTNNRTADKVLNDSAIRFYNEDGKYFDYHFVVSNTINSDEYIEKPTTYMTGFMNSKRNLHTNYSSNGVTVNFVFAPISETLIEYAQGKLDNKVVTKINVVDNTGVAVYDDIELKLDFSQSFFKDFEKYRDSFRTYFDDTKKDTDEYKTSEEYLKNFDIKSLNNDNYKYGIAQSEIEGAKLVWRSIGIGALFFLSFGVIYILLFHFALIKRLVFRSSRTNNQRYVPNKNRGANPYQAKNKNNVINAKVEEVKPNKNDNKAKPEPKKEENQVTNVEDNEVVEVKEEAEATEETRTTEENNN